MNEKVEEPQEQAAERPPIHPELLRKILEAHRKWVESEGKEGERADLFEANLYEANLYEANLYEVNLYGANLYEANLHRANLQGAYLHRANLQGAYLHAANLQGAILGVAKGLTASQVKDAKNWELAFYTKAFLKDLGLPPDHNKTLPDKLAELEKEKKATGAK